MYLISIDIYADISAGGSRGRRGCHGSTTNATNATTTTWNEKGMRIYPRTRYERCCTSWGSCPMNIVQDLCPRVDVSMIWALGCPGKSDPMDTNTQNTQWGRIRTIRDCDKIILEFYIEQTRASLLPLRSYRHIFLFILCFIYITYIYLRLGVLNQCATNLCTFILLWRERA